MKLHYYHQEVNERVVPQVADKLKKIPETLSFDGAYPAGYSIKKICSRLSKIVDELTECSLKVPEYQYSYESTNIHMTDGLIM